MDFDGFDLVGCGVHLCNDDVAAVLVLLAQLLPDGSQLFTVSTPWCIWNRTKMVVKCVCWLLSEPISPITVVLHPNFTGESTDVQVLV